jgi:hypothetical protein
MITGKNTLLKSGHIFSVTAIMLFLLINPFKINSQVSPSATGMILFDDWSPDKTGTADVSDLLQAAVNQCIASSTTLYISSGTYKVTKQILAVCFTGLSCGSHTATTAFAISGDALNRPLIKLADGSPGFQGTTIGTSLAVLQVQHELGVSEGESCLFFSQIKNLNFDLGNNPGAVAVKNASAQDSQLWNINVTGSNFMAGFTGVPGRNAVTLNCEVNGGKYGFYLTNSIGASLFGLKLKNQSVSALHIAIYRGTAITGLEISGCTGIPVTCRGSGTFAGHLVLTDARIETLNSTGYVFDIGGRALVLRNVFIKGSNNIVTATGYTWNLSASEWTKIKTYSFTPSSINTVTAYNLIDGVKSNTAITDFEYVTQAPEDFITKHTPHNLYAFNSPGVKSVTEYGAIAGDGLDDAAAFQTAVNSNDIVFVPAGTFHLSAPIMLRDKSVILGDPGKRSRLKPAFSPSSNTWMLITPDINGYVAIQDLAFDTPDQDYFGAIHWRTSTGFILNVRNYLSSGGSDKNRHNYQFSGKAGGKFFGIVDHTQLYSGKVPGADYRKVYITGTYNPITFYGLNLERGGRSGDTWQNPYLDAINSKNIRVYGSKTETDGIVYSFSGCENISVNALMAHAHVPPIDPVIVALKNGTKNVEITLVHCPYTSQIVTMIDDEQGDIVKRSEFAGIYRSGNFNLGVFDSTNLQTGAKHLLNEEIFVYPSVTKGRVTISPAEYIPENIYLMDLYGRTLRNWEGVAELDLSDLSPGLYFLRIRNLKGQVSLHKIIKC